MDINMNKVVFTRHARDRIEEFNIPIKKAIWMFYNSVEIHPEDDKSFRKYVTNKYNNDGVFYRQFETIVFVAVMKENKFNPNEQVCLIITVNDQRVNLKKVTWLENNLTN